jgi:LPS-assembly lipoprotein
MGSSALRIGLVLLASLVLASCGFRPLYADARTAEGASHLTDIDFFAVRGPVMPRDTMRDALDRRFPDTGSNPRYAAAIDLNQQSTGVAVSIDSNASRFNYTLFATVTYTDRETNQRRVQTLRSIASYAVVPGLYASLVAEEDAVRRATLDLTRKIEADAALYVAGQAPQSSSGSLLQGNGQTDSLRQLEEEAERRRRIEAEEEGVELIEDPVP